MSLCIYSLIKPLVIALMAKYQPFRGNLSSLFPPAACLLGSQVNRVPQVPVLYPGVISEEEKIRAQSQLVMYRRLFMDLEREQVKENIRRRNHRKKIKL